MQITVRYQSVDGVNNRKTFGTIAGVRKFFNKTVGANAEFGSSGMYAVSSDGIGKVTLVEVMNNDTGRRLDSLAAVLKTEIARPTDDEIFEQAMREEAAAERYLETGSYIPPGPKRSPGCTCSEMQLNLVGCDCEAERF